MKSSYACWLLHVTLRSIEHSCWELLAKDLHLKFSFPVRGCVIKKAMDTFFAIYMAVFGSLLVAFVQIKLEKAYHLLSSSCFFSDSHLFEVHVFCHLPEVKKASACLRRTGALPRPVLAVVVLVALAALALAALAAVVAALAALAVALMVAAAALALVVALAAAVLAMVVAAPALAATLMATVLAAVLMAVALAALAPLAPLLIAAVLVAAALAAAAVGKLFSAFLILSFNVSSSFINEVPL